MRRSALAFARWMEARFDTVQEAAARVLDLAPRTLERWREMWTRRALSARSRGRPAQRADRETRRRIPATLREDGSLGVPALSKRLPGLARREFDDLARRWRRTRDCYNVMALSDAAGQVVERYEYQDFGVPEFFDAVRTPIDESTVGNPYLFTGRE